MITLRDILWPDEKIEVLRKMIDAKLTSGQIARELNTTRNAVIGKINRLGLRLLSAQANQAQSRPRPNRLRIIRELRRTSPKKFVVLTANPTVSLPPEPASAPPMRNLSIMELEAHTCRWPLNDGPPQLFCGRETLAGEVYCGPHCRRAYVPARR